ncbi:capsular exopolysaccharide family [Thalassoporum mexicanum PCC 7367]|uniref:GumC family protein n=1 Tax=Thalassoporum mexicanum TaxID=3457544 RepID=UPI00029FA147|nr:polysaccharide biosynthesis tyrosine autokinase [Pseudanabaena sp. PCC 7367]AFY70915.1 capsular exopolysaccharide family [Pseudanabaena sp. PCC 7367]
MNKLNRGWVALRQHKFPALVAFGIIFGGAALVTVRIQPIYEAKGQVLIESTIESTTGSVAAPTTTASIPNPNQDNIASSEGLPPLPTDTAISTIPPGDRLANEAAVIKSNAIAKEVVGVLNQTATENELEAEQSIESFLANLQVTNLPDSEILEISYHDPDPKRAASIVNTVSKIYIASDLETKSLEAKSLLQFVERQLPTSKSALESAEIKLRQFKENYRLVDLEIEKVTTVKAIKEIEAQMLGLQAELAEVGARSKQLQQSLGMDAGLSVAWSSPSAQQLLEELQAIEQQIALESTRYGAEHPSIIDLRAQREALQVVLQGRVGEDLLENLTTQNLRISDTQAQLISNLANLETSKYGLRSRLEALSKLHQDYQKRIDSLPKIEQQQSQLERDLTLARVNYDHLLQQQTSLRSQLRQISAGARIVSPATIPTNAIAPNIPLNLSLGAILGLAFAGLVTFILAAIDKSIKTSEQASDISGYSLLGIVPDFGYVAKHDQMMRKSAKLAKGSVLITRDMPQSTLAETFRILHTNLKFLEPGKAPKVIAITSSIAKEGKSTFTANLAIAAAQMGAKVLLIDADLRKPTQHQLWQVPNSQGLSNVLAGSANFYTTTQQVEPRLELLTAGTLPTNPAALLDSRPMNSLLSVAARNYDLVLLDTPPVTVAADTTVLGKKTDGVVLLVRPGLTEIDSFAAAKDTLTRSRQHVLGLVANGVMPRQPGENYSLNQEYYQAVDAAQTKEALGDRRHNPNGIAVIKPANLTTGKITNSDNNPNSSNSSNRLNNRTPIARIKQNPNQPNNFKPLINDQATGNDLETGNYLTYLNDQNLDDQNLDDQNLDDQNLDDRNPEADQDLHNEHDFTESNLKSDPPKQVDCDGELEIDQVADLNLDISDEFDAELDALESFLEQRSPHLSPEPDQQEQPNHSLKLATSAQSLEDLENDPAIDNVPIQQTIVVESSVVSPILPREIKPVKPISNPYGLDNFTDLEDLEIDQAVEITYVPELSNDLDELELETQPQESLEPHRDRRSDQSESRRQALDNESELGQNLQIQNQNSQKNTEADRGDSASKSISKSISNKWFLDRTRKLN